MPVVVEPGGQRKEAERRHDIYDPSDILFARHPVFTQGVDE